VLVVGSAVAVAEREAARRKIGSVGVEVVEEEKERAFAVALFVEPLNGAVRSGVGAPVEGLGDFVALPLWDQRRRGFGFEVVFVVCKAPGESELRIQHERTHHCSGLVAPCAVELCECGVIASQRESVVE
jgi:hypothetical protein